jgi:Undecaprenyl-phosphate glucose phosphotransferase
MTFVSRYKPWLAGFSVSDVAFLKSEGGYSAAALAADLNAAVASCRRQRPDAVFIAVPWSEQEIIAACADAFQNLPVAIHLAPEPIMARFAHARIMRAGTLSSLRLTRRPLSRAEIAAKRAFDIVAASCGLVLSLPLLILIAALIRLDSPGPVLFRQRRYGFNQQAFRIFKFRTMTTTDDGQIVVQARPGDPRITRLGRLLRRYNLDELPQFLNVLAGDMSLVGPRPHALAHDVEFQRKIANYARRHNVKPGITGWAQVNGLRGETDTDEKMARRIAYDHWYIDNWSFWLDITILFRTVLSRKAFTNAR